MNIELNRENAHLIKLSNGKFLKPTPVFDTYWKFAKIRQDVFIKRIQGENGPWTDDPIISNHRFTNTYRASDRVSQFLIRNVIYAGPQDTDEIFFRVLLFKIFNRIDTWEKLKNSVGEITWKKFNFKKYANILDSIIDSKEKLYSAAYIMPSPAFGNKRKHRNHLMLIEHMMKNKTPDLVASAKSLNEVFCIMKSLPSLGDFLAFQFSIDLNYSEIIDFPESQFVVAGPGAKDGISKCFTDTAGLSNEEIIFIVTQIANNEFKRLNLKFHNLWGRELQPIDCQNIFCEISKYARVAHPDYIGKSGRTKIKQKFNQNRDPLPQFYPPKWNLNIPKEIKRTGLIH